MNYHSIAFSEAARLLQAEHGSRASYARIEARNSTEGLTESEASFIAQQDNFYMSTIGKSGFPYIQFRGGPKGFLKTLDERTLAFVDFSGNKQYISTGNLATNSKTALFLLDQAAKTRLKIFAEAEVLPLEGNAGLLALLKPENYKFTPERIMVLHVKGYDWNCPQHITPRYTVAEIQTAFASQAEYIDKLKAENERLKTLLKQQ
jgi:predicted pyridoxine 5'-phosphate oxidase superfamily flavin-nucleotide-binding protein